jgi:hypothetical protein
MRLPFLGRRAFLRGAGTCIALPWLESLEAALPRTAAKPPLRLAVIVAPNGMLPSAWKPQREPGGAGWSPSFTLEPLAPRRSEVTVFTGLANRQSFSGDGHYAKVAPILTGAQIRRTGGRDLWNGVSMDQLAARAVGGATLLPSLELGCDPIYPVEDMGYSTVYGGHIAWSAPDRPVLKELSPRRVFERLFRRSELAGDPTRGSVLDAVREQAQELRAKLPPRDRAKLEEYEDSLRELERRIAAAMSTTERATELATATAPPDEIPRDYPTHVALMLDLLALAFRIDATRVATFLMANEVSGRDFAFLEGCAGNFHDFSHHEGKPEKQEPYAKINRWHVAQFATLLERLAAVQEGEGTLLDRSMLVFAAAMSDGNSHSPHDLPILLAGGRAAQLEPGRLIASKKDTPLCRLWLSLLRRMGARLERFGDAEEPLV